MELERTIICFDESSDAFQGETKLKKFPIELIKPLWDIGEDTQMVCEYKIERKQFEALKDILPEVRELEWNEKRNAYYLSTSTVE